MKIKDTLKIVEVAWLIVITICAFEIIRALVQGTHEKTSIYIIVGLGATAMYFLRRSQRKRLSNRDNNPFGKQ
ncbi:MAG: hypothetical protein ACK4KT_00660 [Thermaurantimonas sp.]